jgi:hypothetical protein
VEEKAEEDRLEIEAKLDEIQRNHAAKVIQKSWKKHQKRKSKQKGKSKKNKTKKK